MAKEIVLRTRLKGDKKAKDGLKGIDRAVAGLGKSAIKLGGTFFAAQGVIAGFNAIISASGRQELAEKKLETALGKTSNALLSQASALQQVSTFGDEAIIEQQGFLASLKFTEDQIKEIIPVAMDLASATGMSLESAVRNTAKTFSGMAGELGELVPQIRGLTKEQMEAGEAVKIMGDLFGGQALAQTETMAGSLEQMKNSVGDAAEALGSLLAPAVIIIAGGIQKAADFFNGFNNRIEETLELSEKMSKRAWSQLSGAEQVEKLRNIKKELSETYDAGKIGNFDTVLSALSNKIAKQGGITEETQNMINKLIRQGVLVRQEQSSAEDEAFSNYKEQQLQKLDNMRQEEELVKRLVAEYPLLAEQLGLVSDEVETNIPFWNQLKNEIDASTLANIRNASSMFSTTNALGVAGQAAKMAASNFISAKIQETVAEWISDFLKTSPLPPFISAPLALAGGAAFGSLMSSAVARSFATGGDYVTSGPEMIMVGDNPSGRERVQITPLGGDPNINGPQGNGITINISAPLVDETVIDHIIPAIQKAQRLNLA